MKVPSFDERAKEVKLFPNDKHGVDLPRLCSFSCPKYILGCLQFSGLAVSVVFVLWLPQEMRQHLSVFCRWVTRGRETEPQLPSTSTPQSKRFDDFMVFRNLNLGPVSHRGKNQLQNPRIWVKIPDHRSPIHLCNILASCNCSPGFHPILHALDCLRGASVLLTEQNSAFDAIGTSSISCFED